VSSISSSINWKSLPSIVSKTPTGPVWCSEAYLESDTVDCGCVVSTGCCAASPLSARTVEAGSKQARENGLATETSSVR
jgi:hypothetical protein